MARKTKKPERTDEEVPIWGDLALPMHKANRVAEETRASKKPSKKALERGIPPAKKEKR